MCAETSQAFLLRRIRNQTFVDEDDNNLFVTVKLWFANVIRDDEQQLAITSLRNIRQSALCRLKCSN